MTDPRGQKGTLVPLSTAKTYSPGDVPNGGQAFPGARGTAVSLADDPVDTYWNKRGSSLPLTPAGTAAIAGLDLSTADNPRLDCRPTNILFDWTFETDINRITQTPAEIKMLYGSMGLERTIHLDQREHSASITPSVAGHSIGRWENDVLVVDTVGFTPGILSADGRLPHSGGLHVVERFTFDPAKLAAQARLRRRGSDVLHRAVQGLGYRLHLGLAVPRHDAVQGDRGPRGEARGGRAGCRVHNRHGAGEGRQSVVDVLEVVGIAARARAG